MEIRNVKIGDRFTKQLAKNKTVECIVVDFVESKSMVRQEITNVTCWAKSENYGFGKSFEVPFATVLRNKI
jgi:hypothetical protein